ncbi:MAG: hypothetical protein MSA07_02365 [Mucispirillum sp.]|uniref:Carrier domain-containing protein n=1 Tax=Candidatus Mucispirillum faecigallinarum TaxID=2838699 RepID=A0A9D2GS81_9BACT|nr:hypothetical protein [Mucispirillum sp.]HIZ89023.1 hypothetical protein [Candidatus Mucispirillum faecigallinarum]
MDIINDIIYPVLEEIKEDDELDFELSKDLEIYGNDSIFDSISLVRFIVNLQDRILELTDKDIILVSSDIMKKSNSPFKTVSILADYIGGLLENE